MAGEAHNVNSVSASACHGGPIYVNPGELALVYGIHNAIYKEKYITPIGGQSSHPFGLQWLFHETTHIQKSGCTVCTWGQNWAKTSHIKSVSAQTLNFTLYQEGWNLKEAR